MRTCLLLVVVVLLAVPAAAQGIIRGRITDKAGAVIPGVSVTVTAMDGLDRTTITNSAGEYEVSGLAPGSYRVAARLAGFHTGQGTVEVRSGTIAALSMSLAVGSTHEPVCLGVDGVSATADIGPGLRTATRMADAIVHLHIDRVTQTVQRPDLGDVIGYTQWSKYAIRTIAIVKGTDVPDAFWGLDGYRVSDEFVGFLRRNPSTHNLEPFACGTYMVPVRDGRISWRPNGEPDVDGMKVEDFLTRVRALHTGESR